MPTDDWGLIEWFPNVREKKKKAGENGNGEKTNGDEKSSELNAEPPVASEAAATFDKPVETVEEKEVEAK